MATPFAAGPLAVALRRLLASSADSRAALARRLGLSVNETWAVEHLLGQAMGPVELSRRLGITSAAATVLVRRLEQTGHVVRQAHGTDHRRVVLHASPSAHQAVLAALSPMLQGLEAAAADLDGAQQAVLADYLDRAAQVMEEFTGPARAETATGD